MVFTNLTNEIIYLQKSLSGCMTSSLKKLGKSKNQEKEGIQALNAVSMKQVIIVQSEFLCFVNDSVFLTASHKVLPEKLKEQYFRFIFGIILIFTNLAWLIALCCKSAADCFHIFNF